MPHPPSVTLTQEERAALERFVHRGKANARTLTRARILLKSAEGWSTAALAEAFDGSEATVTNARRRFAQGAGGCPARSNPAAPPQRPLRLADGSSHGCRV